MTADRPTEPFVMVPVSVLEAGLTPQQFMTYVAIRRHADNSTLETWVSRKKLAGYLGLSKADSIDPHIRALVDRGLIEVQHRWHAKGDKTDLSFVRDAAHPVRASSLYTVQGCPRQQGEGTPVSGGTVPLSAGDELEPRELQPLNQGEIRSVSARADLDSSSNEPTELPSGWTPNRFHRSSATAKGLDVDVLAREFAFVMDGERRSDWGKAFGAFINEYADGREEVTFPHDDDVEDEFEPTTSIDTTPDPTTEALKWAVGALWAENINPDTLTADERTTITLAWGDEPAADVARRIRENRERRHLTVVPNTTVTEATAQVAAALGELSEDERDAIDLFVDRHGFGADDLVRYIAAWRKGEPFSLIELAPEEYDPFTGVMNPNPAITGAELRDALDRIKRMLPGGFRSSEMETARDAILYGDSWSQVAETLREGRISA